ncbi:helicase-related protein [Treponema zioleckii]|uniref:helicase-related protein n=1 Tax=Treponema zioleckii TaxID=331680 RepID=UPI00168A8E83|nr:ATP-dependent RNA helicase [Treponema zioleckii]
MAIDYQKLPVYEQKELILNSLKDNQVIVVQSPTGSGKTTQIPVILHEAGFSQNGMIAVTQPRRIAALSVSEFIAKQLHTTYPGLVGYKMRFEDKTDATTKIKIMTDGILLQEMKLDPWLRNYSVIMVDEAHERSLNIDFVLGLLKRVLKERKDFKVIVSSATMNAEAFSKYFDGAPIVTIETQTFPVTMVYDPPMGKTTTTTASGSEMLLAKIESTIDRVLDNKEDGDILVFLPGEKIIRDCVKRLSYASFRHKIHIVPLYGRLPKEEQERVFDPAPFGRKKVVISTNIAETSVTINGVTTVIDSGLAKMNYYSPRTFTSSLDETPVSRASCNQRRGRAGRTCPGTCYRLYKREDFESREEYTVEEIYRTDLSEVVLRMSELGITDFESFDFISPPDKEGIRGAVETLNLLNALNEDNTLSSIGKMMVEFPLEPRVSRIIVESIMRYPDVLDEVLIAASFMSTHSPFILPPGEETDARKAHHAFRDIQGDFVSYVKLFRTYQSMKNQERFCNNNYLDYRVMSEIANIKTQLEEEVSALGIPVSGGGSMDDYLCCIASGMIQFVCIREGKENYRSLTADHISIHPGSSMFRSDPLFIVAGEIVRTSRTFAMSVSPLTKALLAHISPELEYRLNQARGKRGRSLTGNLEYKGSTFRDSNGKLLGKNDGRFGGKSQKSKDDNIITLGGISFDIEKIKGKKVLTLPFEKFKTALNQETDQNKMAAIAGIRGKILMGGGYTLLTGEKVELISKITKALNLNIVDERAWPKKLNINIAEEGGIETLFSTLGYTLRVTQAKTKTKELGFITLFSDGKGTYWFKVSRGFATALNESLSSLETLIDETAVALTPEQKAKVNVLYRTLNGLYE